jgi:serine protease Do
MGFCNEKSSPNPMVKRSGTWRWLAVVMVSAVTASGATFLMVPVLVNHGLLPLPAMSFAGTSPLSSSDTQSSFVQVPAPPSAPVNVSVNVNDGVTSAVKVVEPAVMGVVNYSQVSNFFSQQTKLEATGVGTGVLFYKDSQNGYVVTNNHVVQGAVKVDVVFGGGKHVLAMVVGTDPYTDLAVLKVPERDVRNIKAVAFANSDSLQTGEPAIAIGTPMGLDFADSVTAGIVSATKRIMPVEDPNTQQTLDYQAVIQTDAAINPGNSGGPLVNIKGQVIGINSSKIVAPNFEGMGFAIPSNEVQAIADQIMKRGHAVHPALGIEGYSLAALPQQWWPDVPVDYGVWVKSVTSSGTKASGLQDQDVIVSFNGHEVKTMADLRTYLFQTSPGEIAKLRVYRGSKLLNLSVKIGSMDTELTTASTGPNQLDSGGDPLDPFIPSS